MKKKVISVIVAIVIIFVLLISFGVFKISLYPSYIEDDKAKVVKSINKFHDLYNEGKYEEIYSMSSLQNKQSTPLYFVKVALAKNKSIYGKFKAEKDKLVNYIMEYPLRVNAIYFSAFEKTDVTEMFSFVLEDNIYKIEIYRPSKASKGKTNLDGVRKLIDRDKKKNVK